MRTYNVKAILKAALRVACILPFAAVAAFGQQVNLTAGPSSVTLPDGRTVPMWGYSCGAVVPGSTATCTALNPAATGWSPVVITVPTGQGLTINLTNNLSFGTTPNNVPTSLVIVGQLGGGLGTSATLQDSPSHPVQGATWPVGDPTTTNTPPTQGPRVQSFSTEVAAAGSTLTAAQVPSGSSLTWSNLRPGTYLIESGTHPSIQGPMGLYGMLVVTQAPASATPGVAYGSGGTAVSYNADVNLLLSEIDPVQNNAVNNAVSTPGFSETMVWSGQPGGCGNPSSLTYNQCYPPAVNYTPLYYLFNGVAFSKTNPSASLFPKPPATGVSGSVLVRFVNAGLRMHVPSIVGAQTGSAVSGFGLIAEDGNRLPGVTRVQSEVFMAAGKTYDVMVNVPAAGGSALPVFDRQLSLSGNATARDAGMLAYIGINGAGVPSAPAFTAAVANADTYNSLIPCPATPCAAFTVSDPARGVIANDVNVSGVQISTPPAHGTLTLAANGTFTYVPSSAGTTATPDSFVYMANGNAAIVAAVTLGAAPLEAASGITLSNKTYTSNVATSLSIMSPGILLGDKDGAGYPLKVDLSTVSGLPQCSTNAPPCVSVDENGGFNATVLPHTSVAMFNFTYKAKNSQGTTSASAATVTLIFPAPSNLAVSVVDGKTGVALDGQDYRWIIEEDRTFYIDPKCTTNPPAAGCPTASSGIVPTFGTNFHTSYMPVVAQGCTGDISCETGQTFLNPATGTHDNAVCDVGDGACRAGASKAAVDPSQVVLDPNKRYYISVLPGDAIDPGHAMGGAQIAAGQTSVQVIVEPTPLPPAKVSVFVFEDDYPMNGEHDAGGGVDVLAPNEPGLGGFNITLFDDVGGTGDAAGQMTYDMFNMPLSNALAGTIDPSSGLDACPISKNSLVGFDGVASPTGITGVVPVCPRYEANGTTLSPLAGQAVIANLPPGRYGIVATPGADAIARGEEWLQTNTLDGGPAHDSFVKVNEPGYFQEYGPAGYHVTIGFANPKIINGRKAGVCAGATGGCAHAVTGKVTGVHMSRTPDERLYSTGTRDTFGYTQCYASLGSPDGADFAFAKCADDGTFSLDGIPGGDWRVTIFDQWNDQIVDGISTPVRVNAGTVDMGDVAVHQWKTNLYTRTFFDQSGDGVSQEGEPGLSLVPTNIRFRDGSFSNFNSTDLQGFAGFNEVFPLFNWYVVETDSNRYKNTGTHVVYDAGGPVDGSPSCGTPGYPACGTSTIGANLARTKEDVSVPTNLRVPGAVYCDNADCNGFSITNGPGSSASSNLSTGRIDPAWVTAYGWQGFIGQSSFLEFGKTPFAAGENGGIRGHVVYASTRPFDDPSLLLQLSWEPQVPHVTINLYQEGTAPDGSKSLKLVDTTQTSSFDDWAQGFHTDPSDPTKLVPNMNCPGQSTSDLFSFTLAGQPMYLNPGTPLPNNSQFKCFDGLHNFNQLQPAPYDGMYQFPSVTSMNPSTGAPAGTSCHLKTIPEPWGCVPNPDTTDHYRSGTPMLPAGKYVVEMVVPPGYELVKEEDKNILLGDSYIAPVTQQFAGLGNIFILPDQASVAASYNPNNPLNPTTDLGVVPRHEGDTGSVETFWPCVGAARIVPDYMSIFPGSGQNAPFAGAMRNLCDRKEVTLDDQMSVLAKFYVFSSAHVAGHFTGIITDDFTAEFDPFSPQFGEKFAPAHLPVSIKDWAGNEVGRVYADQWGNYDGLNYSSYGVNPPDPSGYVPQMMVMCMNDAGKGQVPDTLFQPEYSQFCYELPFMPGQTGYFDTPVIPTSAFAGAGYNNPDCAYPDATPAIQSVTSSDIAGPWVGATGHTLTITALGNQDVNNYGYSGPSATAAPFNKKKVTRHYGFGTCTSTGGTTGPCTATITNPNGNPVSLGNIQWFDDHITGSVPTGVCPSSGVCAGELVITGANGRQSVDTVTVNVGGPTPMLVSGTIQSAIDAAHAGDLIIVPAGVYHELVIMWKPVRLQGVGAASTIIDANTHPSGVLDPWRAKMVCLFGLALNGQPSTGDGPPSASNPNPFDPSGATTCGGWTDFNGGPNNPQVDRIPLEGIVGWDASVNGNLAEQLAEPTLLGAYEGAGITVVGKGVRYPAGADFIFGTGPDTGSNPTAGQFPLGTILLTNSDADCNTQSGGYTSNFRCKPSRIDGLSVTNSSQGGGGILVHGWAHNLEISNNRVHNNAGTLSGGISIGIGETPDALLAGNNGDPILYDQQPWTCKPGFVVNGVQVASVNGVPDGTELPFCYDTNVNVHHNAITKNSSIGDQLFSATPAGAGGVTICPGSDGYRLTSNWVCGNMSADDGGGITHLGYTENGRIERNAILFNQSTNPTIPTNGGGIMVMTTAPDGLQSVGGTITECGSVTDVDCAPGLGDGTGPGLLINANLIMGNAAESGSGGGIRFQGVNGTEISRFPRTPANWYSVLVQNNIIANNVAGWDGGGVSMRDSLAVNLVNNTIISNDTTASSGVLFNTFRSGLASTPPPAPCTANCGTNSAPQPAGVATAGNSASMIASFSGIGPITCPAGHFVTGSGANNGTCRQISYPLLYNNIIWQNRAFNISVAPMNAQYQQAVVTLVPTLTQPQAGSTASFGGGVTITGGTGACVTPPNGTYWDLGVRGDTGPTNHSSGFTLHPTFSVLSVPPATLGYGGSNNTAGNPDVASQYCNGSRVPPEFGGMGYQVPPGTNEGNVPVPIFNLTAGATVDEGNNWINIIFGPLSMTSPSTGSVLGNYAITTGSSAIDTGTSASVSGVTPPNTDYFGQPRTTLYDIGAVEFRPTPLTLSSISPTSGVRGTAVPVTLTGTNLTGVTNVTVSGTGVTVSNIVVVNATTVTATFTIASNATLSARNVTATSPGGSATLTNAFTVLGPTLTSIAPNAGFRGTTVHVVLSGTNLTGATAVSVSGSGVSASSFTVVNPTTINANITITAGAGLGNRNVTVVTPIGTTNAVTFTVMMQTLNSVTPNSGTRGTSVPVTLIGTGLSTATAVNVTGVNVNASFTIVNDTTINATIIINPSAVLGNHNVMVTTAGGNTNNVPFTVLGATVAFAGPTPAMNGGGLGTKNGTITVSNTASGANAGPLTLTVAPTFTRVSGTGAGTFTITGGTCVNGAVVNPGSSCTITMQYVPTNTSNATYNVTITDTGDSQVSRNSPNFVVN